MPPMRTMSLDKPVKTERTHEENQERAYIAASRRSDRSLEARVESARRASEIHKRRTGRSLRITEQDVVNEEMYEEEDDDLPLQYRRLTAHLQTNSTDFNRRLAAYLTSQMAMRTALDQAVMNSYGAQSAATATYMQNQQAAQQAAYDAAYGTPMLASPTTPTSPFSYRQSPYPTSNAQYRHTPVQRSASIALPPQQPLPTSTSPSMKASDMDKGVLERRASDSIATGSRGKFILSTMKTNVEEEAISEPSLGDSSRSPFSNDTASSSAQKFGPLSTAMPIDSQLFFGSHPNPYDTWTSDPFPTNEKMHQSYYSYHQMHSFEKLSSFHPSYDGMSQTLAPGALDDSGGILTSPTSAMPDDIAASDASLLDYQLDSLQANDCDRTDFDITASTSDHHSATDRDWAHFIDTSWE